MIEIHNITKSYTGRGGLLATESVQALRGVSVTIPEAGAVALLGESGCGKTTLGRILAGLESYDSGDIVVDGVRLSDLPAKARDATFRTVQLIHQDPYAALNPVRTIDTALIDPLTLHAKRTGKDSAWVRARARELVTLVGLNPDEILFKYPHNLSGGQRQRVVIARALTVEPKVLVADEAVSMIDVSLRLEILTLLNDLRHRLGVAIVFITHDVAAARYVAYEGDMYVIYRGEVFEHGPTEDVIQSPVNPYTQSLLSAVPVLVGLEVPGPDRFILTQGIENDTETAGCLFHTRCPFATSRCRANHPELGPVGGHDRLSRCFYPAVRRVVALRNEGRALSS
ncbi:MAG: dipeptide ABC transporter ATP-binding protein [Chloroflexota bacterium]